MRVAQRERLASAARAQRELSAPAPAHKAGGVGVLACARHSDARCRCGARSTALTRVLPARSARRCGASFARYTRGTSALLLLACPSVSACAALSAARAQCDASDGPSQFPPRPVCAFPLIRNPRAGALARSEERRQQGPPPQVRVRAPARSRRRPASSDRGRLRRAGPPRLIRANLAKISSCRIDPPTSLVYGGWHGKGRKKETEPRNTRVRALNR